MSVLEENAPRDGAHAGMPRSSAGAILRPGHNCWKIAEAGRAAPLVDADSYFGALEDAMRRARRSIVIVGWDFDDRITLKHDENALPLGPLLRSLVEAQSELEIHVLVWSASILHAPGDAGTFLWGAEWQEHPRIHLKLDTHHPFYAAHHQKIVTIDDTLAFVGGMDLTVARWDTSRHRGDEPRRIDPAGSPYGPVHDIQMAVDGDAAAAMAELARRRWKKATGEAPDTATAPAPVWPEGVASPFADVGIGIARTEPAFRGQDAVMEAAQLTDDALRAARRQIYIEAQYLTTRRVGDLLRHHLQSDEGPEIVVIMTHESRGLLERLLMGNNRDRLIRRLKKADRHDRLRVWYPCVPGEDGPRQVLVHSKLIIVDDRFLRIGSSNLNNRSIGLDTECDIAIEAAKDSTRDAILELRHRLIAEHLGVEATDVAQAVENEGSLIRAIEKLNVNERGLRPFAALSNSGPTRPVPGTALLDPRGPFGTLGRA